MSKLLVRQAEAGWSAIVAMQNKKARADIANGVKNFLVAGASCPPPNSQNTSNIYNKFSNSLSNIKPDINNQNLRNLLKYLA